VESSVNDGGRLDALGTAIRKLRHERGLSLRDLSRLTGFSISFLSLVERGRSGLALTSLHTLAEALGTEVGSFFPTERAMHEPHPLPYLTRASENSKIAIASSECTYKLLSGRAPNLVLEPLLVTVQPSESMEEPPYSHDGEEFAYVLSGELLYIVDGVDYRLRAGDSIHFQSTVPHTTHNETDAPVEVLWVLTPRLI
jgi:transcriptional regulator with XRE-family HTH domain